MAVNVEYLFQSGRNSWDIQKIFGVILSAFLLKNLINAYFTQLHVQSVGKCQLDKIQIWYGDQTLI